MKDNNRFVTTNEYCPQCKGGPLRKNAQGKWCPDCDWREGRGVESNTMTKEAMAQRIIQALHNAPCPPSAEFEEVRAYMRLSTADLVLKYQALLAEKKEAS